MSFGIIFYKYLSERQELFANGILAEDGIEFMEIDGSSAEGQEYLEAIGEESIAELGYFLKPSELFGALVKRALGDKQTEEIDKLTDVVSSTNIDSTELVLSLENDVIIPSSGESAIDIAIASCVQQSGIALGGDLNIIRTSVLNGIFFAYYLNNSKKTDIAQIAQGNTVVHL